MNETSTKIKRICSACGKETSYGRKDKPKDCPFCHDIYWDKPKDERDLFILQDQYIESGRPNEILGRMYEKMVIYSENIIKKELKKSGMLISKDLLQEKAESMAIKLVERYLKNSNSIIQFSFGGILKKISTGVLYSTKAKQADQEISLEMSLAEDFSMMDNPSYFIKDPVAKREFERSYERDAYEEYDKQYFHEISDEILSLITGMNDRIRYSQNTENSLYFLIGLRNFLDKKKIVSMDLYYDSCKNQDRQNIENAKMILRRYLLDRIGE